MRRWPRGRRSAIPLALLLVLPFAPVGCVNRPALPQSAPEPAPAFAEIQLIARDWHTDISLPVAMLGPALAGLARDFPGTRHLVFGFGDREYLLERDRSSIPLLRALLPGPGAILLTMLATSPEAAFGADHTVLIPVSRAEFERLERFIENSLNWGDDSEAAGRLRPIAEGPYPGSVFHASSIAYSAVYSCNTWTAEALAVAGLPVAASGVLFTSQVMARARRAVVLRRREMAERTEQDAAKPATPQPPARLAIGLSGPERQPCWMPAGWDCCC